MLKTDSNPTIDARFDREGDLDALHFFSESDRGLTPEEYAARHLHKWGCFALHFYRYRDPVLGDWVRRVGELFDHPEELDNVRERLLTADERETIEREAAAGF
jgi:hypothetical protein